MSVIKPYYLNQNGWTSDDYYGLHRYLHRLFLRYDKKKEEIQSMDISQMTDETKAYDIVKASVDTKIGKFTKREIVNICPSISEKSVEAAIKKLMDEGYIIKYGLGKNTFYAKTF